MSFLFIWKLRFAPNWTDSFWGNAILKSTTCYLFQMDNVCCVYSVGVITNIDLTVQFLIISWLKKKSKCASLAFQLPDPGPTHSHKTNLSALIKQHKYRFIFLVSFKTNYLEILCLLSFALMPLPDKVPQNLQSTFKINQTSINRTGNNQKWIKMPLDWLLSP